MFNRIGWDRMTDEKKAKCICEVLSLPTHNGITKDDLLMMLDWAYHESYGCDKPCRAYQDRCKGLKVLKGGGTDE